MLDYDNSAFYYFALTLVLVYLIPGTYSFLKEVFLALFGSSDSDSSVSRTIEEKKKASEIHATNSGFARLRKRSFLINTCLLVLAWALAFYLYSLVQTDGTVQSFDPFHILGVEHGAEDKVIKKACRKLSLQYHPDKNIGSKVAEEMFMKIAKAYEALTDETSKANFEKYGNPDGKQAMELSIGLPVWLHENPKAVLLLYLIGMVVLIPLCVGLWYKNSKKFGDKDIEYETYKAYYVLLKAASKLRHLPEIMCCSAEFRNVNQFRPEDKASISELMGKMQNSKLMERPLYDRQPNILKGNLLLHAHLYRMTSTLTPALVKDLKKMLLMAPDYIDTLVEISRQRGWLETTLQCIRFSQCIKQGLFRNADPLKQIPHLSEESFKEIAKESESKESTLKEFLRTPDAEKKGLNKLTAEERQDVLDTCAIIPCRKTKIDLYVEEEDENIDDDDDSDSESMKPITNGQVSGKDIYEGDLVTIRMSIERPNMKAPTGEAPKRATALAPKFPAAVHEKMWVILTNKIMQGQEQGAAIHAMEKIHDRHHMISTGASADVYTTQHEVRFMSPPKAGDYAMQLYIFSDTYVGLDETLDVTFTVKPASELPVYEPHPDDIDLDNEPTLFEQVMAANADDADSSDDDDDDNTQKQVGNGSDSDSD